METEIESENEVDIEAFSLLCWNCRKEGHRYQDCVFERLWNSQHIQTEL